MYRNHPTLLLNIAPMTLFKRQWRTKVAKIYYFVSGIHFHLIGMQKCIESLWTFKQLKWFTKGEIFTSCFNFDLKQSASRKKKVLKNNLFLSLVKTPFPPL